VCVCVFVCLSVCLCVTSVYSGYTPELIEFVFTFSEIVTAYDSNVVLDEGPSSPMKRNAFRGWSVGLRTL